MLGLYGLNGWFIGMQNTKIPMLIAIVQNLINIFASLLFVFGVIIPCLSQHRLSRCKCPQHPGDLFDEWDNGSLDVYS